LIRYLEHKNIDKKKWDECLASSPNGIVYASSWYLDIVSPQWCALVEDDYKAIFPLCARKKFGFNYLFQPFFTQQGGLFIAGKNCSEDQVKNFIDAIPAKFKLVEINLNTGNFIHEFSPYKVERRRTHLLDLKNEYEQIQKKYSENLRRNIKRAIRFNIQVERSNSIQPIIELFRSTRGKSIDALKEKDYLLLSRLENEAAQREMVSIYCTKNTSGELSAGAVFLKTFDGYIFLFSAAGTEAKETGAMSLIIDRFIQEHSTENKVLDFEGSMNESLARFYKSFGSQEIVYLQIRKNTLPPIIRRFK
jgi:hypothetical protein